MRTLLHRMTTLNLAVPWDRLLVFAAAGALFMSACHDSPRENPLDPVLTPPVELTVALDDTAGTATLTWIPYSGDQPFAEYRVLRNVSRSTVVDTLARISVQSECAYRDTSLAPDTAYEYRVAVVNAGGLAADSAPQRMDGFTTRAIHLHPLVIQPESGTVQLTWTRYRDPLFSQYQVLRRAVGTDREEEMALLRQQGDTTWVDSTARHQVDYAYTVAVDAASQLLHSNPREARLELSPVVVQTAFDSRTATASLTWTRYRGPRFAAYEVWRRTEDLASRLVTRIPAIGQTACIDSNLHGNTRYLYQVQVTTATDEEVPSDEAEGRFHAAVDSWPLELPAGESFVRLYTEPSGDIAALITTREQVRLQVMDGEGRRLSEQALYDRPTVLPSSPFIRPRCTALARATSGQRVLTVVNARQTMVLVFEHDGSMTGRDVELYNLALPDTALPTVEIWLRPGNLEADGAAAGLEIAVDNVVVYANGGIAAHNAFDQGSGEGVQIITNFDLYPQIREGALLLQCYGVPGSDGYLSSSDPSWTELGIEADLWMDKGTVAKLALGRFSTARQVILALDEDDRAKLTWLPGPMAPLVNLPIDLVLFPWVRYRVSLRIIEGRAVAWLRELFLWVGETSDPQWGSLAIIGDRIAVTSDQDRFVISQTGELLQTEEDPAVTSETRTWGSGTTIEIGLCYPDENRVLVGRPIVSSLTGRLTWPLPTARTSRELGTGAGQGDGALLYPLSLDRGPDGRYFVLDAGNARVQVFDAAGRYLTQWGTRGSRPGEFDFGTGHVSTDFSGSICVDDEGYIYVADPGNQRIQKFAP